ncbi:hypothetical protein PsorP6_011070 [Peronosclerospora sorghi]|uniref:Uncharacterized protein n=1 Tax=Peronosclerospora sorghi TaxID=230839 RepID=A0ACC0VUT4_9STRA|nr:hypothetical protein PsorP6_011070 [Peronosclerospora sorghi]
MLSLRKVTSYHQRNKSRKVSSVEPSIMLTLWCTRARPPRSRQRRGDFKCCLMAMATLRKPPVDTSQVKVGALDGEASTINAVDGTGTHATTTTAPKVAPAVIHKPIKITENLHILPSDTEAEKERKRNRNIKQHDWKAFQYKAKKKGMKRGVSGVLYKRGSSIFASPDTVQGCVGVVGIGQGMTEFPDTRKKKFKSD